METQRAYHGTNAEFDTFDLSKFQRGDYGYGIYFTWDKPYASDYGTVKEYDIPKGPYLDWDCSIRWDLDMFDIISDIVWELLDDPKQKELANELDEMIHRDWSNSGACIYNTFTKYWNESDIAKYLRQHGIMGIESDNGKCWVVFDPNDIKTRQVTCENLNEILHTSDNISEKLETVSGIEYLYNPTKSELQGLLNKSKNEVRGILMTDTNEVYVWNAYNYTHSYMDSKLALKGPRIEFRIKNNTIFGNGPDGLLCKEFIDIINDSRLNDLGLQIFNPLNEDYYEQFENYHEIWHTTILQEFENKRTDKIQWNVIPAKQYYNALKQYHRDGADFKFPERILEEWLNLVCENSIRFELLNDFWCLYDGNENALQAVDVMYGDGEEELTCEQAVKILEDIGFYDWARLPDGSEGYSDQKGYVGILSELPNYPTKEEMIVAINRCIDVWHQRGDMAAMLLQGGKETARKITMGTFDESFDIDTINTILEDYINEKLDKLDNCFITNSAYDIVNLLKNKPKEYRILYDKNIDMYMIGDANDVTHWDMIQEAYKNAYYYNIEDFISNLGGALDNYIEVGQSGYWDGETEEENIEPYLWYLVFSPNNEWTLGTDGYNKQYEYSIGYIFTRGCDLDEIDLWNALGTPNNTERLNELYESASKLNANFKAWFGNSKITDSSGNPLVVYHGSPVQFDEFKPDLMNYGSISKGFCFFTNKRNAYPNCAADYAGKNGYIYECYLKMERPLHVRYGNTPEEYYHTPIHYWDTCQSDIRREYRKGNYDGIIIENEDKNNDDSIIYLVPNANQIKCIDNNGNWSESNNIHEELNDNFWKWFGQSKVVDQNGNPLEVYHGSTESFDEFAGGAFFTDDYMNADGYGSGENIYEVYLKIERPLVIDCKGQFWRDLDTPYGTTTQEIISKVDENKYDGVIFKNINDCWIDDAEMGTICTVYYVFNANQIKAVDNEGNWSNSDNIYEHSI